MAFATWYKIVNYTIWFFRYLISTIERLQLHMFNKATRIVTFFNLNASNSKNGVIF